MLQKGRRIRAMNFGRVYSLHNSFPISSLLAFSRIPKRIGFRDAKLSFLNHETQTRQPDQHEVIRSLAILKGDMDTESFDLKIQLFPPGKNELPDEVVTKLPAPGSYAVIVPC